MANSFKSIWLVLVLIAAGVAIFFLTLSQKQGGEQTVTMQEIFSQAPSKQESAFSSNDPVRSPAIVTSPQNGVEASFVVQVYSFQDVNRAQKALADLKAAGYKAYMEVSDLGEKGVWNRVRIGGLANEAQAQDMLNEIRKNYNSGFIVKPKQP